MNYLKTLLQGLIIGAGEIVPVAGASTMALIMGIYDEFVNLLYSIANCAKEVLKFFVFRSSIKNIKQSFSEVDFKFGVPLILGSLLAVLLFTRAMNDLLTTNKAAVYAVVFGLVLSSTLIPFKEIGKIGRREIITMLLSFLSLFIFFGFTSFTDTIANPTPVVFFVIGLLAISAVILPGISVSFLLVLFGIYEHIISYVSNILDFDIVLSEILSLFAFLFGAIIGFIVFVRFLKFSLEKFTGIVFSVLVGAMLASLRVLWPFTPEAGIEIPMIGLIIVGICIPFAIQRLSNSSNKDSLEIETSNND